MFHAVYRHDILLPLQFETEFAQHREDCGEVGETVHAAGWRSVAEAAAAGASSLPCLR